MEVIKRRNALRETFWCVVIAFWGGGIAFTVWRNRYVIEYYNEAAYAVAELALTAVTLVFAVVWWHYSSSDSARAQGPRMWISEHGTLSPLISFLPVWAFAALAHMVCTSLFVERDGYVIYSVFTTPFIYMALAYALPPIEIRETILPGGPIFQKVARIVLTVVLTAAGAGLAFYDLAA